MSVLICIKTDTIETVSFNVCDYLVSQNAVV